MRVVRFLHHFLLAGIACLALVLASFPAIAQTVGTPIPAGSNPRAVAVDPILNKVYILSEFTNQVLALDGATNAITPIPTGNRPQYIGVNPTDHRVYVTNATDATMTVIDGATDTVVSTLNVGGNGPVVVNPITNRIFMVRLSTAATDEVTIIDGDTGSLFSIAIDSFEPDAIALNTVTNKVYVSTFATGDVRIVDGDTNVDFPHPPSVGVFSQPVALAVNPATNRTYVVTNDSRGPFGYIDGNNNNNYTFFTAPGHAASPKAVAVNPVTNMIYAAFDGEVMVMNGATDAFTFIPSGTPGSGPIAVGVNPSTDKIYVPNADGTLTVIDGATNAVTTLSIPAGATSIGVNPVTNTMYVTAPDSVSPVSGAATDTAQAIPLATSITPLANDASDPNPTLTLDASSAFSPVAPPVWRVYYQLDGTTGAWTAASGSGPYSASFSGLSNGPHTLHAFATDTQEAQTVNSGPQSVPLVGSLASYTFTVGTPNVSVSLASSANPSTAGQSVTLTATVTNNASGTTPTGTVAFRDGAGTISGCVAVALDANGAASCTAASLSAGSHSIFAAYSGDGTHDAANSTALTQTVNAATAAVALGSTPNPSSSGQSVTMTATITGSAGSPTGTVAFLDGSSTIGGCGAVAVSSGVAGCSTSALAAGGHTLSASYSGDSFYAAATSNTVTQSVNAPARADPSTSLTSSQQSSSPGQPDVITFSLIVSGNSGTPTGTATFAADGTTISGCSGVALSGGRASCTTSSLATGQHSIGASYSGDATYNPATASTTAAVQEDPVIGIASSANPSVVGNTVTFTATVGGSAGSATGIANFRADGTIISGCDNVVLSNGTATCSTSSLAVGTHAITLRYEGDSNYNVTNSSPLGETVTDANGKTNPAVSLSSSPNPSIPGQAVTLTATASGGLGTPTGNVTFFDGTTQLCIESLASGSAQCQATFAKGTHNLTASYSGDASYNAATSPTDIQPVGALANATWTSSVNPSEQGENVTFTLTLTGANGTPTGTANFLADSATISGCGSVALADGAATCATASLAPGQHNIEILYSGDATYNGFETSPLVQTVDGSASTPTVTLASSANPASFGNPVTLTANVSGNSGTATGTIAFKDGNSTIYGCASVALSSGSAACTTSDLAPGSHSITAQYSGDSSYGAAASNALGQAVQGSVPTQAVAWKARAVDPPQHVLDVFANVADIGPRSAMDAAGNVYVAMSTFDAGANTGCISVVKYAAGNGAVAWQQDSCDAGNTTFAASLALDPSGDVLVSGSHFQSLYLAKLSGATGQPLWTQIVAPSNNLNIGLSVGTASNGDVRLAGWQNGVIQIYGFAGADGSLQWRRDLTNNVGSARLVAFRVDGGGGSAVSEFDSDGNNTTTSAITRLDNFGSIAWNVAAAADHLAIDSGGNVLSTVTNSVTKRDAATGATLWTVPVPAISLAVDGQDNVYATGTWGSEPDDDIATSKVSPSGSVLWSRAFVDPALSGNGASIAVDSSGNPVATGFGRGASTGNGTRQSTIKYDAADGHILWMATDQDSLGGSFPYAVNTSAGGTATVGAIFNQSTGQRGGVYAIKYADGAPLATPSVSLASSANPSSAGQRVTFVANVSGSAGAATGTVAFKDGSSTISGCATVALSSGSASCTASALTAGTHSITAAYSGDAHYGASNSSALTQTVNGTAATPASITSPMPGTTLAGDTVTFTWNASGASLYQVWVGSTQGAYDIGFFPDRGTTGTSATATGLPTDGRTLYVRLYSAINGAYQFRDFTYTATGSGAQPPGPASIMSPMDGSTLTGSSQLFQWNASGASLYQLWVGSTQGAYDIGFFPQNGTTGTSVTATGLPTDGRTLYVRLYSAINGAYQFRDFTYTAAGSGAVPPGPAVMQSPANGSTLSGSSATFAWNAATGASLYQVWVGSTQGTYDVGFFPQNGTTGTSVTVSGLPTDGRTLFVRLYTAIGDTWYFNDYMYTAAGSGATPPGPAVMQTPANGSTLSGSTANFTWNAATGASLYQVWVGTSPGAYDVGFFPQNGTTATSATATGLPTDGRTLYVRLYTAVGNTWYFNDYTYKSGP